MDGSGSYSVVDAVAKGMVMMIIMMMKITLEEQREIYSPTSSYFFIFLQYKYNNKK